MAGNEVFVSYIYGGCATFLCWERKIWRPRPRSLAQVVNFFPPPNNGDAQKNKSVCNAQYRAAKKLLERGLVWFSLGSQLETLSPFIPYGMAGRPADPRVQSPLLYRLEAVDFLHSLACAHAQSLINPSCFLGRARKSPGAKLNKGKLLGFMFISRCTHTTRTPRTHSRRPRSHRRAQEWNGKKALTWESDTLFSNLSGYHWQKNIYFRLFFGFSGEKISNLNIYPQKIKKFIFSAK